MTDKTEQKKPLEVLIIDDHTLFRQGLEALLVRRDIDVVASVGDGAEGIEQAKKLKPSVILLDLRMPAMNGIGVLRKLITERVRVPILILTTSTDEGDFVDAIEDGACGYLLKDMDPDELVNSLHKAVSGKTVISPSMHYAYMRMASGESAKPHPINNLTPREKEILECLAEGKSNKMIAKQLSISDGTVKLHVKSVLRKLQVKSRVEAAVIAVEYGIRSRKSRSRVAELRISSHKV